MKLIRSPSVYLSYRSSSSLDTAKGFHSVESGSFMTLGLISLQEAKIGSTSSTFNAAWFTFKAGFYVIQVVTSHDSLKYLRFIAIFAALSVIPGGYLGLVIDLVLFLGADLEEAATDAYVFLIFWFIRVL